MSSRSTPHRAGFTLVEMMVAVGLTVLMMTMVVTVFGLVMDSIRGSRASIEITDRVRAARNRLQLDLAGVTAPLTPPLDPAKGLGYFELIEGPMGPVYHPTEVMEYSVISDIPDATRWSGYGADTTVGDLDDVLMFTMRSDDEPFVGKASVATFDGGGAFAGMRVKPVQSRVAEVAWFVRGTTLYRRVLLVATPVLALDERWPTLGEIDFARRNNNFNFWQFNDLSVHLEGSPDFSGATVDMTAVKVVPNTLGDLTKRENRYAHQPFAWPHDARFWGNLSLPTLEECSANLPEIGPLDYFALGANANNLWVANTEPTITPPPTERRLFVPNMVPPPAAAGPGNPFTPNTSNAPYPLQRLALTPDPSYAVKHFDGWRHPHPAIEQDHATGQIVRNGARIGEDVILTNVLSCDVKVWDPGAPIISLYDTSDPTYVTVDTVNADDPPIRYPDGTGKTLAESATAYSVRRLATAIVNNTNQDRIVGFGAYVDLNYMCRTGGTYPPANMAGSMAVSLDPSPPSPQFHHNGDPRSGLMGTFPTNTGARVVDPPPNIPDLPAISARELIPSVYDTYSTHYESDGINQSAVPWNAAPFPNADVGVNGIDDDGDGAVDESTAWPVVTGGENETAPPYPHPIRGIQIKIRVFEPDTRLIREVTLEHEFLPQ